MIKPKYPVGIQTFEKIRKGDYVYVDKTEYIYNLASKGQYYFLSRPRRFGKSLLLSTIEAVFRGQRELFDGLFIAGTDWKWEEHPVFHLALNGQDYTSVDRLDEILHNYMSLWERQYDLPKAETGIDVSTRFFNCIINAFEKTGRQVVILIDEYDQPLLQNIEQGKEDLHQKMREHLQAFYSVMKSQDKYIRFGMLSGISKFSRVSVFSGLNNINDISLDVQTNAICGISESELARDFQIGIQQLAEVNEMTIEETRGLLKKKYDGYLFAESGEGIYNPFSLLKTFDKDRFNNYWIQSGTPRFLMDLLKERDWDLTQLSGSTCSMMDIIGSDRYLNNPLPILSQSGYLTIKSYDREFDEFTLDYPNEEVSQGFSYELLKNYSDNGNSASIITDFVKDVRKGNAEAFMRTLQSLLADVPYDQIMDKEMHYENIMYLIMKLMGFYSHTEYKTSDGRIDMVVKTDRYIYVMEFKLHGTAEEAMAQIREKEYALPFTKEHKQIILIGAAFNPDTRRLDNWLIENY